MSCRYCPTGVQGTVLGIAFDLSVLPYLLRPFPGFSPSGRPRSVGPSRLRLRQSEKSCKQRFGESPVGDAGQSRKRAPFLFCQAFRSEGRAGVGSERCSSSARPSGRRGGPKSEARPSGRRGGPESEVSERHSSLARPSGQRLDHHFGPSLGFWASPGVTCRSQCRLLG